MLKGLTPGDAGLVLFKNWHYCFKSAHLPGLAFWIKLPLLTYEKEDIARLKLGVRAL